jgi:hypothetical protein
MFTTEGLSFSAKSAKLSGAPLEWAIPIVKNIRKICVKKK